MKIQNLVYFGAQGKAAQYDIAIPEHFNGVLIYFIHGYKGYKNWGGWDLISDYFYEQGFGFAKCNLSHNGTTLKAPNAFDDLDSFGKNCYSYELEDIQNFINEVDVKNQEKKIEKRILIGHSRGGGGAILSVSKNPVIDGLVTWAAISDIESRFPKGSLLEKWKKDGVFYVLNGRTNQNMPHQFSFYSDFITNKEALNIKTKASQISIPWCIIHGKQDTSVKPEEAYNLHSFSQNADLVFIENANHVFGCKEPYTAKTLPTDTQILIEKTLQFIRKI